MAVAVGALAAIHPPAALIAASMPVVGWMVATPSRRLWTTVFGGLLALGSDGLTIPKMIYLAVMVVIVTAVVGRFVSGRARHIPAPVFASAVTFVGVLLLASVGGAFRGNAPLDILRDTATYMLIPAAALVVADAAPSVTRRAGRAVLLVTGLMSSVFVWIEWVQLRGYVELSIGDFFLPSGFPAVALWSYSIVRITREGRQAIWWLVPAVVSIGFPLATGTRSAILYLLAPVGMLVAAARHGERRYALRVAAAGPLLVLLAVALLLVLADQEDSTQQALSRLQSLQQLEVENLDEAPSLAARWVQNRTAAEAVADQPLLGQGPGHRFEFSYQVKGPLEASLSTFTMDTSLTVVAKLGLLGTAVLIWFLLTTSRCLAPLHPAWSQTMSGFLAVLIPMMVLNNPLENKGLAIAVAIMLASGAAERPLQRPEVEPSNDADEAGPRRFDVALPEAAS